MSQGIDALQKVEAEDAPAKAGSTSVRLNDDQIRDGSNGRDWPAYGRTHGEQHFSPLDQIDEANIGRLGLMWSLDVEPGNTATAPIEIDGTIYFASGYSLVHAVDALSGKLLWEFDPGAAQAAGQKLRQGWGSRGIAWWNGKVYTGTQDGRLIALDAKTGKLVWSQLTVGADDVRFISGAPRVFDGKIIIGHGGADSGPTRGYVTTYDAESGKQLWRFYTVPGDPAKGFENEAMEMAARTWAGQWWKYGGGGTVWNAMTYDAGTDTIIIGVGNGTPWNWKIRSEGKGDNLFLSSLVGLDAKTGAYKWHYQTNPGETWDYTAAMDMELADLSISGQVRKVVMTAPKNGFFYVIDRTNGKLISAEPFVKVTWASRIDLQTGRPVEIPGARYPDGSTFILKPSAAGGHSWQPMAYSAQSGLAYIPSIELAFSYSDQGIDPKTWKRSPGNIMEGAVNYRVAIDAKDPPGSALIAWNPVTQKQVWSVPTPGIWNGGVLATAGHLVFQGRIDGKFNAYAADSGKLLWSFAAQAPVIAPPISFRVGDRQFITVLSGGAGTSGSSAGPLLSAAVDYRTVARRVLTFSIGGKAVLPAASPVNIIPIEDPAYHANGAAEGAGALTFNNHCASCHGPALIAAGQAPDLRTSAVPQSPQTFAAVIRDGTLVSMGMPRFNDLSDVEREDLRQYIRAETATLRHSKLGCTPHGLTPCTGFARPQNIAPNSP